MDGALEPLRNLAKVAPAAKPLQWVFGALLLLALLLPWDRGMGGSASAFGLQRKLEGPKQLSSLVTRKGRIARDYRLAGRLWLLAAAEAAALAFALLSTGALAAWPGLLVGLIAATAAGWARHEIASFPFQRPGSGIALTWWCGLGLAMASALRLLPAVPASTPKD